MASLIRITYRENVDHFAEAQSQTPAQMGKLIPDKVQNTFIALLIIGTLLYSCVSEYGKSGEIAIPLLASLGVLVIMGLWLWLFKKLGLFKNKNTLEYHWTDKDRMRFQRSYRKRTGRDETLVVCEFDENGFRLIPEQANVTSYEWTSIVRVIERPKGLFVYFRRWLYYWFPKTAFASDTDYQELMRLIGSRVARFERM